MATVIRNVVTVGCLLSAVAVTVAETPRRSSSNGCDGVLEWPADGSGDVRCDVVPHVIDASRVHGLTGLDVSRNHLDGIRVVSNTTVTLAALDLSRNNIPNACRVFTGRTVRVRALVLSYNKIRRFSVCSDAKNLTLSWNYIRSLNKTDMVNASSLEILDLGNNFVLWIEDDAFAGAPGLRWLDLSGNALTRISDRTLPSAGLRYLDVSENRDLDRSTVFQPFENLVELNIARNAQLAPAVLGSGPRLQALDVSHTDLTRVPVTPAPLLGSLILSGNAITAVNGGDLDGFPLLRLLNISGNRVAAVEDDAFGRLDLLAVLDLSGNRLETVPKSLPAGLETLNLERNRIRSLGADDFDGCTGLRTLNVRGNGISDVREFAFGALTYLDALDLSENPIVMITREMLTGPARLRTLIMERVPAPDTPAFPFTDTRYLARLRLAYSDRLATTLLNDTAVWSSMGQLEHLDLTGCDGVTALPVRLPYHMPKMKTLALPDRLRCEGARPWLADWLCEIGRRAADDRTADGRDASGRRTTLALITNRRRSAERRAGPSPWTTDARCTRDDDGRIERLLPDPGGCAAAAVVVGTTPATYYHDRDRTAAADEQVAVFARLRAKDEGAGSPRLTVVADAPGPGAVPFACVASVSVLLLLVVCGTVWIGVARADALKRLRWRQSAPDVDYQSIEIKCLGSPNRVQRW